MRCFFSAIKVLAFALLAVPALAQPPEDSEIPEGVPRGPMVRERLLRAFDKDNSGSLDDDEREAMRAQFRERFERRREERGEERARDDDRERERRRDEGSRDGDRGGERRGPDGPSRFDGMRGPRGPMGGPPFGPPLEPLFDWFDGDSDNSLSREEFRALSDFVRRHAQRRRGGPPGGPRFGREDDERSWRRGPEGERREDRQRGERGERRERERRSDRPADPPQPANPPSPPSTPQPDPTPASDAI